MSKSIIIIWFSVLLLLTISRVGWAGQEQFVSEYVAAVNSNDIEKLKRLVHPKCLACINNENQDYFDEYYSKEILESIPNTYKITRVTPILKAQPLLMPEAFSYPVRPTHWIQIDFERSEYNFKSIIRQVVQVNDTWFMVVPCPTPQTVKQFRQAKIDKEKQKTRAMALFQELQNPLLAEVKQLLDEGKRIQAWKRYSSVTGESLSMAKDVLSLLKEPLPESKDAKPSPQGYKPKWAAAAIGRTYAGLEDLTKDQQSRGYIVIGRFGNSWPAAIEEVNIEMDEITFERQNGQKQKYAGFNGYELVLLRLRAVNNQNENVVIFRSRDKK